MFHLHAGVLKDMRVTTWKHIEERLKIGASTSILDTLNTREGILPGDFNSRTQNARKDPLLGQYAKKAYNDN